jgi:hypothetical protein
MSDENGCDMDRLSLIDDFVIESILAEEAEETGEDDLAAVLNAMDRAEVALRKGRLATLRKQIDQERAVPRVLNFDADRMRAKLAAAAYDPGFRMTLAARSAKSDGDEQSLLEDLAELERDAGDDVNT